MIRSPPNLGLDATVDELFSPSGGWNVELIHNTFLPDVAKSILQVPIAVGTNPDALLWHYKTCGRYTVGSGYWQARGLHRSPCSSMASPLRYWWTSFWRLHIPLKVKIFFWRACFDWIPTNFNIARRGILVNGRCGACQASPETTKHALLDCKKLNHIRTEWSHVRTAVRGNPASFFDFVTALFAVASEEDNELFCVLVWRVWGCRNAVLHGTYNMDKSEIFCWSQDFLAEFRSHFRGQNQVLPLAPPIPVQWTPPVLRGFKLNCAVAFGRNGEQIGLGMVIRDSTCEVFACCSQSVGSNLNTRTSKLVAIQRGLQFGLDCGIFLSVFEMDDVQLINWVNSGHHFDSEYGAILMNILHLSVCFHGLLFCHVPASANKAARGLATYVLGGVGDTFWMEESPSCISDVLETEKSV
ncbi:hypothetical protein Dsin_021552 [Dipteronia sinensis]|uniref:Reverse transcriptase zinc-binding domain-containing protein n=1 Tax=Dipteronia sinensis TaxID=43782 RepID=A0AAE0A0R3_9ROSI|nr:hypothetical protein Dsin_021552 [Dipteronia sinensis]